MKKTLSTLLFLLFLFSVSLASSGDDKDKVKSLIGADARRKGLDSLASVRAFDVFIKTFGIKKVVLRYTRTGMNHYNVFSKTLIINWRDSSVDLFEKVLGEITHAVQFNHKPVYYGLNAGVTFTRVFLKALFPAEKYRHKIDSVRHHSATPCSKLRSAFIGVYLADCYLNPRSFEFEHRFLDEALRILFLDLVQVSQHLSKEELSQWIKMRKKQLYDDLRYWWGSFVLEK